MEQNKTWGIHYDIVINKDQCTFNINHKYRAIKLWLCNKISEELKECLLNWETKVFKSCDHLWECHKNIIRVERF